MRTMGELIPRASGPWDRVRDASTRMLGEKLVLLVVLVVVVLLATSGRAVAAQPDFASPEEAVAALVTALDGKSREPVAAILGATGEWMSSGDRVADRRTVASFLERYRAKHAITLDSDRATLVVGEDDFPFAFPLVRTGARWRFDADAGKDEMLARRIGANELTAIQVLRAIVDAQLEYASVDRNGDGVVEYAKKFRSTPGKRDGLYWKAKAGEPESPLGPLLAQASAEGYGQDKSKSGVTPYHGYVFRMLDGQGKPGAPDAIDYVVRSHKIGGFAVLAYPAKYGNTGIMTFAVTHDGVVVETDLGPQTAALGGKMKRLELGPSWHKVAASK
jgi:hypothetical protein